MGDEKLISCISQKEATKGLARQRNQASKHSLTILHLSTEQTRGKPSMCCVDSANQAVLERVNNMQVVLPLVAELHSEFMRDRHWKQLMSIAGQTFTIGSPLIGRSKPLHSLPFACLFACLVGWLCNWWVVSPYCFFFACFVPDELMC